MLLLAISFGFQRAFQMGKPAATTKYFVWKPFLFLRSHHSLCADDKCAWKKRLLRYDRVRGCVSDKQRNCACLPSKLCFHRAETLSKSFFRN